MSDDLRLLNALPASVLLSFRDTVSAALRCSITITGNDAQPVKIERFQVQRRFTARVCQLYHCKEGSGVRKEVCEQWDLEAAAAVRQSGQVHTSPCALGYWCTAIPVVAHGAQIGMILAGERWLSENQDRVSHFVEKGLSLLERHQPLPVAERDRYRTEFHQCATPAYAITREQAAVVTTSLMDFAEFLGLLVEECAGVSIGKGSSARDVWRDAEVFVPPVRRALSRISHPKAAVLASLLIGAAPFSDQWLREFVDPSVLDPDKSGRLFRLAYSVFADIRGFTELCGTRGVEVIDRARTKLLARAHDCMKQHGGVVDKFMGDGLLGYFFSPHEDRMEEVRGEIAELAVARAVANCCLELKEMVEHTPQGDALRFGIGMSHGEVLYGHFLYQHNENSRREATAIGSSVNEASRLCALARRWAWLSDRIVGELNPVLVSKGAVKHLRELREVSCAEVARVRLKGFGLDNYGPVYALKRRDEVAERVAGGEDVINLRLGFVAVPPHYVTDAITDYYEFKRFRTYENTPLPLGRPEEDLPQALANLLRCSARSLTFRHGTTGAIEAAIESVLFDLRSQAILGHAGGEKRGPVAAITDLDHPTVGETCGFYFDQIAKIRYSKVKRAKAASTEYIVEVFRDAVRKWMTPELWPTVFILPHVTWEAGIAFPFRDMAAWVRQQAESKGLPTPYIIIDGAHGFGHVPVELELFENMAPSFHFYATCLHKWFQGPHGVGLLYVSPEIMRSERARRRLAWGDTFTCTSGLAGTGAIDYVPKYGQEGPQFRTQDRAKAYASLAAAVWLKKSLERVPGGMREHFSRATRVRNQIREALMEIPNTTDYAPCPGDGGTTTAILSLTVRGYALQQYMLLSRRLEAHGILVDVIPSEKGGIRVCASPELTDDHIVRITTAFKAELRRESGEYGGLPE